MEQLEDNLRKLEELVTRLQFLNKELINVLKIKEQAYKTRKNDGCLL